MSAYNQRDAVDAALHAFATSVVPDARCVSSVTLVDHPLRSPAGRAAGAYDRLTGAVRVGAETLRVTALGGTPLVVGLDAVALMAVHEACHGVDVGLDLTPTLSAPGAGRAETAERLADLCERGLRGVELAHAAAEACGPSPRLDLLDALRSAAADPLVSQPLAWTAAPPRTWRPPPGFHVPVPIGLLPLPPHHVRVDIASDAGEEEVTLDLLRAEPALHDPPFDPTWWGGPAPEELEGWLPPDWIVTSSAWQDGDPVVVASKELPDGEVLWGLFVERDGAVEVHVAAWAVKSKAVRT